MEEWFFFWKFFGSPPWEVKKYLSLIERKWFIDRFIEQEQKEAEAFKKARR